MKHRVVSGDLLHHLPAIEYIDLANFIRSILGCIAPEDFWRPLYMWSLSINRAVSYSGWIVQSKTGHMTAAVLSRFPLLYSSSFVLLRSNNTPYLSFPNIVLRDILKFVNYHYICFFICSFLRSVSYREFSRLVYGFLGNKRYPLPACAYDAIRKTFPCSKDEEFTGFELDEDAI